MSIVRIAAYGRGDDSFVITREQISKLIDVSYEQGLKKGFKPGWFEYKNDAHWESVRFGQVARAERLNTVTANHLRKARKTIRELRGRVERLQDRCYKKDLLLDRYRGQIGRDNPFASVPEHYEGDGYVTCDRAIESASSQKCIAKRSPLQFWYWATAMKYVWRMWSKEDPEKDALKAIDCLEKAAGLGRLVEIDGAEVVE